jgi:hypothetical protein
VKIPTNYKPEACVSKDTGRISINQGAEVCKGADGPVLVSCTGQVMTVVPIRFEEDGADPRGPISTEALEHACKLAKKAKLAECDIKIVGDKYIFTDGSTLPRTSPPADYSFPDWRDVIPAKAPVPRDPAVTVLCLDLKLLNLIAKGLGAEKGNLELTIRADADGSVSGPVLVHRTNDTKAFGVLMPVRP